MHVVTHCQTLCLPIDQPDLPAGTVCFANGKPAKNGHFAQMAVIVVIAMELSADAA